MPKIKKYYWLASYPLQPGSIIDPGNWGRIISQYPIASSSSLALREYIFESIRLKFFPEKPSRLESIFLCESEEDIKRFKLTNSRNFDLVFEVEIIDDSKPKGDFDYTLTNFSNQPETINDYKLKAEMYWKGNFQENGSKKF